MAQNLNTLIRAGILIPVDEALETRKQGQKLRTLRDYALGITDDHITVLKPWSEIERVLKDSKIQCEEFVDAREHIVMPGLINAHSHLPMTLFRGLADDLPFNEWLFQNILPLEARLVSPEFVTLGTELACLESLRSGITTTHDMYYFEPQIAETLARCGLRGVIGEHIFDLPAPDNKNQNGADFKLAAEVVENYKNHPLIHPIISPHAPYTCGDETLKKVLQFAEKYSVPIGMHVSETEYEVEESLKKYGMTPLQRLEKLGLLEVPFIAAHCVQLTDQEIEIAALKKMGISHNPESNMKLGVGIARVPQLLKAGIAVGLGTDSVASNNDLNIFGEMDTAAKLQKLAQKNNTALVASDALWMATRLGAEALKLGKITGSLELGKRADVIGIRCSEAHMQPLHDPIAQVVYSAQGSEVDFSFVNGVKRLAKRECLSIDSHSLFARLREYRQIHKL